MGHHTHSLGPAEYRSRREFIDEDGQLTWQRLPKLASIAFRYVLEELPISCDRIGPPGETVIIETAVIWMNIDQGHTPMRGNPIKFADPYFRSLLTQQQEQG